MEMKAEYEAMEIDDDSPEFTFSEILQMEKLFKEMSEPISEVFCRELSEKFNCSSFRSESSSIKWTQVQSWFQDKQSELADKVPSLPKGTIDSKTAVIKKGAKVRTIPASEAAVELSNLMFEARSAKDSAWFDVGSFLTYKFLCSGELVVRVRFSGFGKEEDEWVSVRRAVRERSIPFEHSECDKINVGDHVLSFREGEDHALYCDAHVVEIERKAHDINGCTCIFLVRYDHDSVEGKVTLDKLCYRPMKSVTEGNDESKMVSLVPNGMQKLMLFEG